MKQQNRVSLDISICKMKEHFVPFFVHFVCYLLWTFYSWKMLLSSQNKVFRADANCIKEMQINYESFVIVRNKKFMPKQDSSKWHVYLIFF